MAYSIGSYRTSNYGLTGGIVFVKVTAVNTSTKVIAWVAIENNLTYGKTGTAKPLYTTVKVPSVGNIIGILRAPTTEAGKQGAQYSKEIYYTDPIAINQQVNNNTVRPPATLPTTNTIQPIQSGIPGLSKYLNTSIAAAKQTSIGIVAYKPKSLPPLQTKQLRENKGVFLGRQAVIPNVSNIPDNKITTIPGVTYQRNEFTDKIEVAIIDNWPVDKNIVKAIVAMKDAIKSQTGETLILSSGYRPAWDEFYQVIKDDNGKEIEIRASSQVRLKRRAGEAETGVAKAGQSNHGTGLAIDVNTGTQYPIDGIYERALNVKIYKWMNDNAYKYGFIRGTPREEWHWEFQPGRYQFSFVEPTDKTYKLKRNGELLYTKYW
jgi:hypothetical protein